MKQNSKCDSCGAQSKVFLAYGPHNFCEKHFSWFFEKRIRKTIRLNQLIRRGEKILVALSGGKDSTLALHFLKKLFGKTNEITALIIDEGIPGYRSKAIEIAVENCTKWNVPFKIVSFQSEFGLTDAEIMKKIESDETLGSTCSFCGTLRRRLMDKYAFQLKAGKLATGHNLDDEVQSISMNFFDNDLKRFQRLGPISQKTESFVPRIKPLHETPEKEIIMYCAFNGIKHFSEECCPFSWMAKRNAFREMLNDMESKFPGTKYSILRFFQQVKGKLLEKKQGKTISKINYCINCGFPSSGTTCKACEMVEKLKNSSSKKAIKQSENVSKKPSNAKTCNELKILAT